MHTPSTLPPPASQAQRPDGTALTALDTEEFLAAMAHELKNPLNLIQLNVELLLRLSAAGKQAEIARAAESIRRALVQQAQAIDDMGDVARLQRGTLPLARLPMDWAEAVRAMVDLVADEARRKQVNLSTELPAVPAMIDADRERIDQIAWNLLTNALKSTPAGGQVAVTLKTTGTCAELEVRDTGRGIAPHALPFVFDVSRPVTNAAVPTRSGGLGVGMALVRRLAEAHGGEVEAASDGLDLGARFVVRLPTIPR